MSQGESISDGLRHLYGITVARDVHIKDARGFSDQVIVHCGFLNTASLELGHDRFDLAFSQDQIAHHYGGSPVFLECRPGTERQNGLDFHAVESYMKVLSWHPEANYISRDLSCPAHNILNRLPVGRRRWRLRRCECCSQKKHDGAKKLTGHCCKHTILHISSCEFQ